VPYAVRTGTSEQTTLFAVNTGHFGCGDTRLKNATIFRTLATRLASYFAPSLEKYGVTMALVLQLLLEFLTIFCGPIHSAVGIEEHDAAALSAGKFRLNLSFCSPDCTHSISHIKWHSFKRITNEGTVMN
jgi:hypothetical protein